MIWSQEANYWPRSNSPTFGSQTTFPQASLRIIEKTQSEFRKLSVQMMYVLQGVKDFMSKA